MITIDYCGYHTHNMDYDTIFRPAGTESWLFLLILSPMNFYLPDNSTIPAKPGACIIYAPNTYQHYQAEKDFFNSFVHFFCSNSVMMEYPIRHNELFYPDNTEELNWLLKKIHQEFIRKSSGSEKMLSLYTQQLLILIHRSQKQENISPEQRLHIYPELLALREYMVGTCHESWTIAQLCDILNIGKSQLYKYYEQFFHCSPKEDLIQARLQKARFILTNEAVSIKQTAYDCGFQNISHFNRLFRRYNGLTPSEYRRQIRR